MNLIACAVVGLLVGALFALRPQAQGPAHRIETLVVAVFGAFVGGDFLAAMLRGAPADDTFRASSLALAAGGAVVLLMLLALMRRTVGPMRPHKLPRRPRP